MAQAYEIVIWSVQNRLRWQIFYPININHQWVLHWICSCPPTPPPFQDEGMRRSSTLQPLPIFHAFPYQSVPMRHRPLAQLPYPPKKLHTFSFLPINLSMKLQLILVKQISGQSNLDKLDSHWTKSIRLKLIGHLGWKSAKDQLFSKSNQAKQRQKA